METESGEQLILLGRGRRICASLHGRSALKLCSKERLGQRRSGFTNVHTTVPASISVLLQPCDTLWPSFQERWVKLVCFLVLLGVCRSLCWHHGAIKYSLWVSACNETIQQRHPAHRDLLHTWGISAVVRYWDLGLRYDQPLCFLDSCHMYSKTLWFSFM